MPPALEVRYAHSPHPAGATGTFRTLLYGTLDPLSNIDVAALNRSLCDWFAESRRDLPWRVDADPYAIWISEAMLQQTRVETVLPYFERFLARFPDVVALARASQEEVLAQWSGLGYYRRARSLWAAARVVTERHGGLFPETREEWLELPGVGPYTAGAVLSIALQRAEPLVDGNVARVLCRLFGIRLDPRSGAGNREIWRIAAALVPAASERRTRPPKVCPGNWNQGLMELGALVCTPRRADCAVCPLRAGCHARRAGTALELPVSVPRPAPIDVRVEVLLLGTSSECLLVRRPATGRMAGMWELPTRELPNESGERFLWPAEDGHSRGLRSRALASETEREALGTLRHTITRHRIRVDVVSRTVGRDERVAQSEEARWVEPATLGELALTGMTRKVLRRFGERYLAG